MALKPPPAPAVKQLACKNCGAPVQIRAPGRSLVVACGACGAVLDAQDPDFRVIAQFEAKTKVVPKIPLGARGRLKGEPFEVVGMLIRETTIQGETFTCWEYLLFNPYQGFRWLSEYSGHWVLSKTASGTPKPGPSQRVTYLDITFTHFQTAVARVKYVIGEFPWIVRVGASATVTDYVAPPHLLSCERTQDETTWSIGESIEGEALWKAFNLQGAPPARYGVGAAQPNPLLRDIKRVGWLLASFVAAAVAIHLVFAIFSQQRVVFQTTHSWQRGAERTLVTDPFELTGRRSNVVIDLQASVANTWAYFDLSLVNDATAAALNFGREIGFYSGRDSDGAWSEGAGWDRVYLPSVASGRYHLVIDLDTNAPTLQWSITVRRDVPRALYAWAVAGVLLLPPLVLWYRSFRFEYTRWQESDHPKVALAAASDDDD